MSELAQCAAKMLDMLPRQEQALACEFIVRMVRAWDPDFTRLTSSEAEALHVAEAECARGETVSDDAVRWDT